MKQFAFDQDKIVVCGHRKDPDGNPTAQRATATIWFPSSQQIETARVSIRIDIEDWDEPLVDRELQGEDSLEAFQLALILATTSMTNNTS